MKQVTWPLANEKTTRCVKKQKTKRKQTSRQFSLSLTQRSCDHVTWHWFHVQWPQKQQGVGLSCQNDPLPVLTGNQQEQWLQFHHVANRLQGGQSLMMSQTTESFRIHMEIKCKQSATATQQWLPVDNGKKIKQPPKTLSPLPVSGLLNRKWRQQGPILRPFQNKIPACDLDAGGGANKAASESVASQYWVSS